MKKRAFDAQALAILTDPGRWKIVSPFFPPEQPAVRNPRHRRWLEAHGDNHSHPEVLLVLRGRSLHSLGDQIYRCAPGTVFFFDSHVPHDLGYPAGSPSVDHLWIGIVQNRFFARLIRIRGGHMAVASEDSFFFTAEEGGIHPGEMLAGLRDAPGLPPAAARLGLLALLAAIMAKLVQLDVRPASARNLRHQQREKIAAIRQHIRETSGAGATLDKLARLAGYSKFHFVRLFLKYAGRPVHQYVNDCRRHRVAELLRQGVAQKTIAAELGFSCPASFSRWYRRFKPQIPRPA